MENTENRNNTPPTFDTLGIIRSSSKALTVTSHNFSDLRNQITDIHNQRISLQRKLKNEQFKLLLSRILYVLGFLIVIGFFYKGLKEQKDRQSSIVSSLQQQLDESFIKLSFADQSQLEKSWLNCLDAFGELSKCDKIWDITYAESVDRVKTRSTAKTAIRRDQISYKKEIIEFIRTDVESISIPNANGPGIFVYPTFLILFKDKSNLGIFDLKDVRLIFEFTGYIEEESVPKDGQVVDHTWKMANKDGSMDKRFKGNYKIPVVKYGQLTFQSDTGLEESYMFSNPDTFSEFSNSFTHHLSLVKKL